MPVRLARGDVPAKGRGSLENPQMSRGSEGSGEEPEHGGEEPEHGAGERRFGSRLCRLKRSCVEQGCQEARMK